LRPCARTGKPVHSTPVQPGTTASSLLAQSILPGRPLRPTPTRPAAHDLPHVSDRQPTQIEPSAATRPQHPRPAGRAERRFHSPGSAGSGGGRRSLACLAVLARPGGCPCQGGTGRQASGSILSGFPGGAEQVPP